MGWGPIGALRRFLSWSDDFDFESFDFDDTVKLDFAEEGFKSRGRCPCRRLPVEEEVRLQVFDLPRAFSREVFDLPRAFSREGFGDDLKTTPKRAGQGCASPKRTRVFVRTPSQELRPADVDLAWTVLEATEHILASCGWNYPDASGKDPKDCSLRFRRRILRADSTLKECGAELGCVLGLLHEDN
eukprot:TRINITY_DN3270_c0_g1_i1.p1 TRINITY_DN3270_c0_g1~~TRINITY_DN3270_c0_g1_i1.p1  ORF type:complete len:186 (+),score=35.37 TRINITY_DN3270_c0_g1_i1:31-588(+)